MRNSSNSGVSEVTGWHRYLAGLPLPVSLKGVSTAALLMGLRTATLFVKFGLTLYLAKYLSLEILGLYGLLSAAQILLPALASLGLNLSLTRYAVTEAPDAVVRRIYGYLLLVFTFYLLGTLAALLILGEAYSPAFIVVASALLLFENLNSDAYNLLTNRMQPVLANVLHFIRSALWALVFMSMGWWSAEFHSFAWMLTCWTAGSVSAFLMLAWSLRRWPFGSLSWFSAGGLVALVQEIRQSWFLFINGVVTRLGSQADRFIVSVMLGLELTGVYVFFVQIASALSNLHYTGIIQVLRPKVLISSKQGTAVFKRALRSVMAASAISTVVTGIAAYFVISATIPYLNKPELSAWRGLLYFVLIGVVFNVAVEAQRLYFYSLHKDKAAFYINLATTLPALAVLVVLTETLSLLGAGIALVAAGGVRLGAYFVAINRSNRQLSASPQTG